MAGTAKVAFAAGFAKSTSAEAVVPVRSIGVAAPPPIGNATDTVPSRVTSRWTLLAASVDLRAAVTISFGSVRAGALRSCRHAPSDEREGRGEREDGGGVGGT